MKTVYLAGPTVFFENPHEAAAELKALCNKYGLEGHFPLDVQIKLDSAMSGPQIAREIFEANVRLIDRCDGILVDLRPFRGPGADNGSAWEMGYAYKAGKPIVGYSGDERDYWSRVKTFYEDAGGIRQEQDSGRWRDPLGHEVENFQGGDNLMLSCSAIETYPAAEPAIARLASALNAR